MVNGKTVISSALSDLGRPFWPTKYCTRAPVRRPPSFLAMAKTVDGARALTCCCGDNPIAIPS